MEKILEGLSHLREVHSKDTKSSSLKARLYCIMSGTRILLGSDSFSIIAEKHYIFNQFCRRVNMMLLKQEWE